MFIDEETIHLFVLAIVLPVAHYDDQPQLNIHDIMFRVRHAERQVLEERC